MADIQVVGVQSYSAADSTFTLTNPAGAGRALVVVASQIRNTVNLTGFTFDGVTGTTVGMKTDSTNLYRTLASYWADGNLPASAGSYNIARNSTTTGGTEYTVYELAGVDDITQLEVLGFDEQASGQPNPYTVTFANSVAGAFLALAFQPNASSGPYTAGAGQTADVDTNRHNISHKIDSSDTGQLSISGGSFENSALTWTAIGINPVVGPSITLSGDLEPGATITATLTNFSTYPTDVTITDSNSNSITRPLTQVSGDDHTFTMPDLPSSGSSAILLFGTVTVEATS